MIEALCKPSLRPRRVVVDARRGAGWGTRSLVYWPMARDADSAWRQLDPDNANSSAAGKPADWDSKEPSGFVQIDNGAVSVGGFDSSL